MKTKQRAIWRLLPLGLAMAAGGMTLAGCDSSKAAAVAGPAAPTITVAQVLEQEVAETREFAGRLEARQRIELRARVAGTITEVRLKPGTLVQRGEVLFVIDKRPFEAEAARTAAALAMAQAKAALARSELERATRLFAERAIAEREYVEKQAASQELEAAVRLAQAAHATARLQLEFTEVRAPIAGRVGKAEIVAGNLIDSSAVLTTLVSDDRIYASFNGDESIYQDVNRLARRGAAVPVRVALASETGFPHTGKLDFVDNQLNARSGGVRMRALLDNPDGTLLPGLFVRVQLARAPEAERALLVEERAVGTDQSHKYVVVVGADNKAEYRPVTLGANVGQLRVVRSGLKAGERVVVNGLQRVQPGAAVQVQLVSMGQGAASQMAALGAGEGQP